MRLKKWLATLILLVLATGCTAPEPAVDNSAAVAAHTALIERLASAAVYKVELRTDETMVNMREINVTAPLVKDLAATLAEARPAVVELTALGDYERHLGYTVTSGELLNVDYFRCGSNHAEYPDQAIAWVDENGQESHYLIDAETFDTAYALLEEATYTPEIPVSEFVDPIQGAIEGYRNGSLPPDGDKLYQGLPEGTVLPDVASTGDFTVEPGGMFGYTATVPTEDSWDMVVELAFFDGYGWEVAGVSFQRKPEEDDDNAGQEESLGEDDQPAGQQDE